MKRTIIASLLAVCSTAAGARETIRTVQWWADHHTERAQMMQSCRASAWVARSPTCSDVMTADLTAHAQALRAQLR